MEVGVVVNVLGSFHQHFLSLIKEGLWGFPLDKRGINRIRFDRLVKGAYVLLYFEHHGVRGIWCLCRLIDKFINTKPVKYWIMNPTGYPLQIKLDFILPSNIKSIDIFDSIKPIRQEELISFFNLGFFKSGRWSLYVFGKRKEKGVTYTYDRFKMLIDEFEARNAAKLPEKIGHEEIKEMLYKIGQIQGKYPEKEYPLEDRRIDVVWRKTPRSAPYIAFEIHIRGDIYADLVKLKHAYDIWNAIPVLVVEENKIDEARKWIGGTFHEIKDFFRIILVKQVEEFYEAKRKLKELENMLGIP